MSKVSFMFAMIPYKVRQGGSRAYSGVLIVGVVSDAGKILAKKWYAESQVRRVRFVYDVWNVVRPISTTVVT